jgi:hypothetical protein
VRDKFGEHPTVKLKQVDVARYAREADQLIVEAERAAVPTRTSGSIYPDIEVSVEDVSLGSDLPPPPEREAPAALPPSPEPEIEIPTNDQSAVRPASREEEAPRLESVPVVVASKEDLAWFQLEESAHVILAMIDGESTVEAIADMLTIPRSDTLAILRELDAHGVIEFRES